MLSLCSAFLFMVINKVYQSRRFQGGAHTICKANSVPPKKRQPRYTTALKPYPTKASPYGDHTSRIKKDGFCRLFFCRILGCAIRRTTVPKHQSSVSHISTVAFRGLRPTSPRTFEKVRSRNTALPPAASHSPQLKFFGESLRTPFSQKRGSHKKLNLFKTFNAEHEDRCAADLHLVTEAVVAHPASERGSRWVELLASGTKIA